MTNSTERPPQDLVAIHIARAQLPIRERSKQLLEFLHGLLNRGTVARLLASHLFHERMHEVQGKTFLYDRPVVNKDMASTEDTRRHTCMKSSRIMFPRW